jgi:hypothetical protein
MDITGGHRGLTGAEAILKQRAIKANFPHDAYTVVGEQILPSAAEVWAVTGVAPARILVIGGGVVGQRRRASPSAPRGRLVVARVRSSPRRVVRASRLASIDKVRQPAAVILSAGER